MGSVDVLAVGGKRLLGDDPPNDHMSRRFILTYLDAQRTAEVLHPGPVATEFLLLSNDFVTSVAMAHRREFPESVFGVAPAQETDVALVDCSGITGVGVRDLLDCVRG
jgi:hypothetical protein